MFCLISERRLKARGKWGFIMPICSSPRSPYFKQAAMVFAFVSIAAAPHQSALAITLQAKGGGVYLSGSIKAGDQIEFREFLAQTNALFVDLDSKGGSIEAAGQIGYIIRSKKLPTVVDASRSTCGSACTIIFAAGTTRHYLGGEKINDHVGSTKEKGLGYHEGNNFLANGAKGQSGAATGQAIGWYYEFGSSKAKELATRADWKHFYYVSSATALELGLATSTKRP